MGGSILGNRVIRKEDPKFLTTGGEYVDDLLDGFLALMDAPDDLPGPVNIGNPGEFTIRELAEMTRSVLLNRLKTGQCCFIGTLCLRCLNQT